MVALEDGDRALSCEHTKYTAMFRAILPEKQLRAD